MNEITNEIMQLVAIAVANHYNYDENDLRIIGNQIDTNNEILSVSFDKDIDWNFKLSYSLTAPEVYIKIEYIYPEETEETNE